MLPSAVIIAILCALEKRDVLDGLRKKRRKENRLESIRPSAGETAGYAQLSGGVNRNSLFHGARVNEQRNGKSRL